MSEVIESEVIDFQFTRHGTSCNNEGLGEVLGKDFEPSLTENGIDGILKVREASPGIFDSNEVYVSPLIRTWCTAVLLYSQNNKALTLNISPYLKEKLTGPILRGNFPEELNKSIPKFVMFLNMIKNLPFNGRMTHEIILKINDENVEENNLGSIRALWAARAAAATGAKASPAPWPPCGASSSTSAWPWPWP